MFDDPVFDYGLEIYVDSSVLLFLNIFPFWLFVTTFLSGSVQVGKFEKKSTNNRMVGSDSRLCATGSS